MPIALRRRASDCRQSAHVGRSIRVVGKTDYHGRRVAAFLFKKKARSTAAGLRRTERRRKEKFEMWQAGINPTRAEADKLTHSLGITREEIEANERNMPELPR